MRRAILVFALVFLASLAVPGGLRPPPSTSPTTEAAVLPPPSGATIGSPLNYDFTAGEPVVSAPANHDFEDGLTGWTVTFPGEGSVTTPSSGGQSGGYLQITGTANLKPRVTSTDTFMVDSSSPVWSVYINTFGNGGANFNVEISESPFTSWSILAFGGSSNTGWQRLDKHLGSFVGKDVKIRYRAFGTVGYDEGAARKIPNWTVTNGAPRWEQEATIKATTASTGDFDLGATTCLGADVPGRTTPAVFIPGSAGVESEPFTIPGHAAVMYFLIDGEGVGASATLRLYLESEGYAIAHILFNKTIGTDSFFTSCEVLGAWQGEKAKVRLTGSSGGSLRVSIAAAGESSLGSKYPDLSPDPVSLVTGEFLHDQTDIAIPGKGLPLNFGRTYSSAASTTDGVLGWGWRHNYEAGLTIFPLSGDVNVRYPSGGDAYFTFSGGSFTAPVGVNDTLVKNGDNTYTLTTTSNVEFDFDVNGKLTGITDRNGNTTTVAYDGNGDIDTVTDPGGRQLTFTVDGNGRITQVSDPLSRTVGFAYDSSGDLVTVTDVTLGTTDFTYSNHRLETITDSLSQLQVTNIYDEASRVVEQLDALNGVTCFYYGHGVTYTSANCAGVSPAPAAGETVMVDPRGNKQTHQFDTSFRPTGIEDALGNVTLFTYEAPGSLCSPADNGNLCSVTDPLDHVTSFTYDSQGNVLTEKDALNNTWTYAYTALNDIDLETDPLGRDTDYVYDASGNLTEVIKKDDLGSVVSRTCFTRDSAGLMTELNESTTLTNCTGYTTKLQYDTNGNPTEIINARFSGQPTPPKTTFTFDVGGRVETVTNELGHTITKTYDSQNNVLTAADNLNNTTSFTYDARGHQKTTTDANRQPVGPPETGAQCGTAGTGDGIDDDADTVADDGCPSTISTYDSAGRLTDVVDALGQTTSYGYDANGNPITVTKADRQPVGAPETGSQCGSSGTGNGIDEDSDTVADDGCPSTVTAYDDLNRLQSITDSLGRVTSSQYDAASNVSERTDARGLVTKYAYDLVDRLTDIDHYLSDGMTLVDSIDYVYDAVGNRLSTTDPTGTTSYDDYDALDRLKQVTFPGPKVVSYLFDNAGDLQRITYPDAKSVDYTYDEAHNMKTVTDWLGNQTVYDYDDASNLIKRQYPNGVSADIGYDAADRLTSVVNNGPSGLISTYTYTPDAVGVRTQMVDSSGTHTYTYDELYRLTEVTYPGPETDTYSYDPVGNRLSKDSTLYTYDDADQMTTAGGVSYGYDNNGNQTSRASDTFQYDHDNRLTQTVIGGVTSSYAYNGDGLRVSQTVGASTTNYTWSIASALPVILQDDDNSYAYGLDLISATDASTVSQALPLDVVVSSSNLTGATVANLDDDPDAPDADWATATSVADTSLQAGFPTPPSDPAVGADLQEFRVLLRKDASGGSDPSYDLELWETGGGAPLATLVSDATLSSDTGVVVSGTWDASLLATADGSAVELRVVGNRSGGNPNNRRTVEVGAVEWKAAYAGNQTYFLYDGLGSTSDLTDGSGNVVDGYTYDVFGALRSQSGTSSNYWLFTGEQADSQSASTTQRLPLDVVVSSSNLTGATVANLDDDPDAPDADWATATSVADTSLQAGFPTPPSDPAVGADLQEFRVLLRKDVSGGNDPDYDLELWESGGGAPLATLVSGATLSSDTGEVVSVTWDASLLGTADGSAVELRVVGNRSGGNPSKRRTVEVGAVEWNAVFEAPASNLYYLRARYYDPATGRFLGQDPVPFLQRYSYVGNSPTNLVDPSGRQSGGGSDAERAYCSYGVLGDKNPIPDFWDWAQDYVTGNNRVADCLIVDLLVDLATAESEEIWNCASGQRYQLGLCPEEADAFRHCYGSVLLTNQFGNNRAEFFTDLHEQIPDNDPRQMAMDIHNNMVGRLLAEKFGGDNRAKNWCLRLTDSGRLVTDHVGDPRVQ